MGATPRSSGVQVDDVEPPGARVGKAPRDGDGVVRVRGLARKVPLSEPDDATAAQVDRRKNLELACVHRFIMVAF